MLVRPRAVTGLIAVVAAATVFVAVPASAYADAAIVASTVSIELTPGTVEVFTGSATATATVSAPGASPTGSVEFFVDGASVGSGDLDANGSATINLGSFTTVGNVSVGAVYAGDGTVLGSDAQTSINVVKQNPTISLSASPSVIKVHKTKPQVTVTLSAIGFTPTGPVTLSSGSASWTATLEGGSATFSLPGFKQTGDQTLRVTYLGDGLTESASRSFVVTVVK
jgi:hypothetical protein